MDTYDGVILLAPLEDHFQVENSTARETDRLRRSRQIFTARPALS